MPRARIFRRSLKTASGAASLVSIFAATAVAADRPNLLLITADNLGYGDVGCFGNERIKTPRIDALAHEGVRLTDFYTASPTCTVSRASLLTGRYPQRHKLTYQLPGIKGNYGVGLRHSEVLLPELLRPLGYRTACFGKWNIGFAPGSRPTERGFGEFFGHASGNIDYYRHVYNGRLDMHRGTKPVRLEGYATDLFADAACRFIEEHRQRPFFVYLPFNAPHFPNPRNKQPGEKAIWQAPPQAFERYGLDPDTEDSQARYYAVVTALDDAIGRVLDALDAAGVAERTLVVFYSDNGAFMLKDRGLEVASNAPLKDGGVTLWEGGIRVPCIVRWPGKFEAGTTCAEPLFSCDILPMFVRAAGGKLPRDLAIDGRDPTATLAGEAKSPHEAIFFQYEKYSAVRSRRYKLLRTNPQQPFMLFDLKNDIGEKNNLAAEHPEIVKRLAEMHDAWRTSLAR